VGATGPSRLEAPRFACRLLHWVLGSQRAEPVEEGLEELFRLRVERDGPAAARAWYRRQVLGFIWRRRSLRDGSPRTGALEPERPPRWRILADAWAQDVKLAARSLRRAPGFTALAVGTLAIGIAANATVFSVLDGALLRPLPIPDAERLMAVHVHWSQDDGDGTRNPSYEIFRRWRDGGLSSADAVIAYPGLRSMHLAGAANGANEAVVQTVSSQFFLVAAARAAIGRVLTSADHQPGANAVVVLSHQLWRETMAADPNVLGRTLRLNGEPHVVVGVLTPDFRFEPRAETIYRALPAAGPGEPEDGDLVSVFVRMRDGATPQQLAAELRSFLAGVSGSGESPDRVIGVILDPMRDDLYGWAIGRFGPFMGVVACVLLLVAANLANLVLVRFTSRSGEMAVRAALGAGRGRLARQVALEIALITAAAAALGTLLTSWGIAILMSTDPMRVSEMVPQLDTRVVGFAVGVALLAGLLAALAPAIAAVTGDFVSGLRQSVRQTAGGGRKRLVRRALVVFQIACSLLLLTGAGLLTKTIIGMQQHDPGFAIDNLVNVRLTIPEGGYGSSPERALLVEQLLDRLRAVPGVVSAGTIGAGGSFSFGLTETAGGITLEGHDERLTAAAAGERGSYSNVSIDYLRTLDVPIVRGRPFVDADFAATAPPVAIVNEEAANRWWPAGTDPGAESSEQVMTSTSTPPRAGARSAIRRPSGRGEALGSRLKLGPPDSANPWITVVGVVKTYRSHYVSESFAREDTPRVYLPLNRDSLAGWPSYYVRTAAAPGPLVASLKAAIEDVDPAILFRDAVHLRDERDDEIAYYAVNANILLAFALFGVVIAAMGIYGVVAYGVARRTREIGIRKALGARTGHVFRTVTRESVILAAIGIALGLGLSAALTRGLESMLHGLSPLDPTVYAVVSVLLALVVALATYLPARRATRVDAVVALRMG